MPIDPTTHPSFEAIIFDLDGTLADTIPLIVSSFNAACRVPLGRELSSEAVIARFGIPDAAMVRRELQEFPAATAEEAVEKFYRHYETEHGMVAAFPGVPELLRALHGRGIPLGLMTGKGRRTADITLRALGWEDFFGSVVTGEDIEHQKPHPEGVLKAAQALNVAPQNCLFIGDSPADIEAGQAAAMKTVAVVWHAYYKDKLRASGADFWAETPAELAAFLDVGEDETQTV
jgi:2-phosphoglycolate phosphatase